MLCSHLGVVRRTHGFRGSSWCATYAKTAYPTSQGDGLILGMSAGGAIVGGEKYASLPGLVPDAWQYPAK